MSKTASAELKAHLASDTTTVCTLWKITRRDGVSLYFTDLDKTITYGGNDYVTAVGYNRSAIQSDLGGSVDNMDTEGFLDNLLLTEEDMRAGLYNHAKVLIVLVNWQDLSMGHMILRSGWLGEVTLSSSGKFSTEIRGLSQALTKIIGYQYQPECRADLGDDDCTIDIEGAEWARNGAVTATTSRRIFDCSITSPDPRASDVTWYVGGILTWLTGNNTGFSTEVKTWDGSNTLELFLSTPYAIQIGDTFKIRPGCNKSSHCKDRFNNRINMQAEPFIPGTDIIGQYIIPGT